MLDTNSFLDHLINEGYSHLCVVPCSFAKHLINAAINCGDRLEYVPCASEAVACSVAAGLSMSGKRPVVVVQSSGLTNMGSCVTSLLKPYGVRFPIVVSWRSYKPGDSEIQHAHLAKRLPDLIRAYGYRYQLFDQTSEQAAVEQMNVCERQDQMLVLRQNTFSAVDLLPAQRLNLTDFPSRGEYLSVMSRHYQGTAVIFIGTTGNTAREMHTFMSGRNNFYMAGNMGGALSIGLGAAKGGRRVVVCGGDAEFVMHMGALATTGRYANQSLDLTYLVFDNESNKSTGGQRSYQENVDYSGIAAACGAGNPGSVNDLSSFTSLLHRFDQHCGFKFAHIKVSYDKDVARPSAEEIILSTRVFKSQGQEQEPRVE